MGVYEPAEDGLPAYFFAMLDDADRNEQFRIAICRAIAAFKAQQGRAPRVLDFGCGTGMLSAFALRAGAAHVTALDVNKVICEVCEHSLSTEFDSANFLVVHGTIKPTRENATASRFSYTPKDKFDMLVTEMLGTLATSENMFEYTENVLPYLNTFADVGVYIVPQCVRQFATLYHFPSLYASSNEAAPIRNAFYGMIPVPNTSSGAVNLISSQTIGVPLHLCDPSAVSSMALIRVDTHLCRDGGEPKWIERELPYSNFQPLELLSLGTQDEGRLTMEHFLVFEWTAHLWDNVTLENTLACLGRLPPRNAAARHAHWGFMFCRVCTSTSASKRSLAQLQLQATGWDKGIPAIRIRLKFEDQQPVGSDPRPPRHGDGKRKPTCASDDARLLREWKKSGGKYEARPRDSNPNKNDHFYTAANGTCFTSWSQAKCYLLDNITAEAKKYLLAKTTVNGSKSKKKRKMDCLVPCQKRMATQPAMAQHRDTVTDSSPQSLTSTGRSVKPSLWNGRPAQERLIFDGSTSQSRSIGSVPSPGMIRLWIKSDWASASDVPTATPTCIFGANRVGSMSGAVGLFCDGTLCTWDGTNWLPLSLAAVVQPKTWTCLCFYVADGEMALYIGGKLHNKVCIA